MSDQGTKAVERKIDEPEKSGVAQTGARPDESEGQHREREQKQQEKQTDK